MTRSTHSITIDGDPEAIFRLVTQIEKWPALFPRVRRVEHLRGQRWLVRASWLWLPISFVVAQRETQDHRGVEQRIGWRAGVRLSCHWTIEPTQSGRTRLGVEIVAVRRPWLLPALLLRSAGHSLTSHILAMIRLLAESDREAHESTA